MLRRLLDDRPDDPGVLRQQVVAAHPGLAGEARGDDDDVRARRVRVVVRPDDARVVPDDRRRLGQVEPLALRQPLDDVDEDDVGEPRLGNSLGSRGADVAGADDGDLVAGHAGGAPFGSFRGGRSFYGGSQRPPDATFDGGAGGDSSVAASSAATDDVRVNLSLES